MKKVTTLIRLRRSAIARMASVVLVLLVVSPFTAPFSTCEFADLGGETPLHGDLLSSSKTVKDVSATDVVVTARAPVFMLSLLSTRSYSGREETRRVPLVVLRL